VIDGATLYKARCCSSSLINNYQLPGYESPVSLPGAINAPSGYIGYQHFDNFNPSQCAAACDAKLAYNKAHPRSDGSYEACDFFTTYTQQTNGIPDGMFCAFYKQSWNATYATNYGQYRNGTLVSITNAFSYTRSK
jgi:hypothetical protein